MNREIPFELEHVRVRLEQDFTGLIVGTGNSEEDQKRNFRSKALAAFAVHCLSGCDLQEAAQSVVDSGGDGGIDAVYLSPTGTDMLIVQSKFFNNGQGEPGLGDVAKFKEGIENLMTRQFDGFQQSETFKPKLPAIQAYLNTTGRVRVVLVYSGIQTVSEDRIRIFEKLEQRFSDEPDEFRVRSYNLTSVHDWLTDAQDAPGVDLELVLHQPASFGNPAPFKMFYGLVELRELASLYAKHGTALVKANIREYKGKTEVNRNIQQTLQDAPEHFPYLNNGLTAYCAAITVVTGYRGDDQKKQLKLTRFCIVNGAQTLGSIGESVTKQQALEGFVFIKIISLQHCENEQEFAEQITRATNLQNQVGLRDFAALDPEQERIAAHLELSGIHYHYRDSANTPDPDPENFDFEEALVSLACLEPSYKPNPNSTTQEFLCALVVSNRNALRSQAIPDGHLESRYRQIFKPTRSARTIWRAVQTKRLVIEQMQNDTRASTGKRKVFFENARWLVLNLIFLKLHPERGEELQLGAAELENIRRMTIEIAETLWGTVQTEIRHFKTVFSNVNDCLMLKARVLENLK
jgi:AIPR protein